MIVTCAKCSTQFQLDEARVPEAGIRVRCSVCKHAFFVEHPDAFGEVPSDPVARAVEEVLDVEAPDLPEPLDDLEAAQPASGTGEDPPRDEEDWEWSDDGPLAASAEAPQDRFEESFQAARAAVDDLLGSPDAGPDQTTFSALPAAEPERREPAAPDTALDARGFEAEAPLPLADDPWDTPAWNERVSEAPQDPGPMLHPDLADPGEELETGMDREPLDAGSGDLDPFSDELAGPRDGGLATPDALDFDEPDAVEPPGSGALDAPSGLELEAPPAAVPLAGPALAPSRAVESPPVGIGARLEPERVRAPLAALGRAGSALGWSVVTILAAGLLWASVTPRTAPGAGVGSQSVAGLEATGIEGRWVENAIVGPLYVVRGELRNAGPEPKSPGARLVVRLLDAAGAPLDAPGASLAPPAPTAWLREAHPRELRSAREAAAQHLARTPLAPGASIPFEAVVENLPDAARRFDLAVAPPGAVVRREGS